MGRLIGLTLEEKEPVKVEPKADKPKAEPKKEIKKPAKASE